MNKTRSNTLIRRLTVLCAALSLSLSASCGDDDATTHEPSKDASTPLDAAFDARVPVPKDGGDGRGGSGGASMLPDANDPEGAASCERKEARYEAFIAEPQLCSVDADCEVIGDCGHSDFRAVRADIADEASRLMRELCYSDADGPGYVARCEAGACVLEESRRLCCGCEFGDADVDLDGGS